MGSLFQSCSSSLEENAANAFETANFSFSLVFSLPLALVFALALASGIDGPTVVSGAGVSDPSERRDSFKGSLCID